MSGDARYRLDYGLSRLIRYNGKRQRFFEKLHRLTSFVNALAASSAFVALLTVGSAKTALWLTGLIAVMSAADSVIGFAEHARLFGNQRRRYFDLYSELMLCPSNKFSEPKFREKRLRIDRDGPPPLRVLDVICRNEEDIARGFSEKETIHINPFRRFFCQIIDLSPRKWVKVKDRRTRKKSRKNSSRRSNKSIAASPRTTA